MSKKANGAAGEGLSAATRLVQIGRDPYSHERVINPPIQRGSTVLFDNADDLYRAGPLSDMKGYGLEGLSTQDRLCDALTEISGGIGTVLAPSGLQALTLALMAATKAGDHVLLTDSSYGPTRRFCREVLGNYGVETEIYDPRIGGDIAGLIRPNTCLIILESPGSLTFELQDVPAITAVAKAHGVATLIDDTWTAGLYMKPFDLGVDISMQALTKYQGGHADVLAGALITNSAEWLTKLKTMHQMLGIGTSAEDAWLTLRGLRTMGLRMAHQDRVAREIARWLEARPEVAQVLHPALSSHPDHAIWQRDFSGAGGLFSVVFKQFPASKINAMAEAYEIFSMGFSWGGFESLALPSTVQITRQFPARHPNGPIMRYSIGLEAPEDLIADLDRGFAVLNAA
ncbi:MAG: cystathionine beta-lyase [Aquidulcibacter sp.]|jgi:cystathionine beta-lyase|uniref:cystathionine beta-lyase n=1 Tax=Aquidulcibacter sp. TaxID=2052990 RepID=UPI0022C93D2C|nr:cystathionine beta-lyase [Aquidulcibacter sp.]MCE2892030.1 cystathionine beta-lyase [Hyphomonadaceae bacterium]MCZ8208339.1 cystathionine beta-lyase [Aquidulcibacter sp.]